MPPVHRGFLARRRVRSPVGAAEPCRRHAAASPPSRAADWRWRTGRAVRCARPAVGCPWPMARGVFGPWPGAVGRWPGVRGAGPVLSAAPWCRRSAGGSPPGGCVPARRPRPSGRAAPRRQPRLPTWTLSGTRRRGLAAAAACAMRAQPCVPTRAPGRVRRCGLSPARRRRFQRCAPARGLSRGLRTGAAGPPPGGRGRCGRPVPPRRADSPVPGGPPAAATRRVPCP